MLGRPAHRNCEHLSKVGACYDQDRHTREALLWWPGAPATDKNHGVDTGWPMALLVVSAH
jgi:hypothetical protein